MIGLIPSPLCLSCGVETHTFVHLFSWPLYPTSQAEKHQWKRPFLHQNSCLTSLWWEIIGLPSITPPPPKVLNPLLLTDMRGNHHHHLPFSPPEISPSYLSGMRDGIIIIIMTYRSPLVCTHGTSDTSAHHLLFFSNTACWPRL